MKNVILIKLGGSIITEKESPDTARIDRIESFARQIKAVVAEKPDLKIVLGHGSGSFAHVPAKKYRVQSGIRTDDQIFGMCEVADAAARLNRLFIRVFLNEGVRVMSFPPSAWITAAGGKVLKSDISPLVNALSSRIIPVVYGDMLTDNQNRGTVFSTEQVFDALISASRIQNLNISRIIQVGKTAGVLDRNGSTIANIKAENITEVRTMIGQTAGYDVTGGMLHKIESSLHLASLGISTLLISGERENTLRNAVLGGKTTGTVIGNIK